MNRRELLRRGGAAALFGSLAAVLAQGEVVAKATAAVEAAPVAKKAGLTKRLLVENKRLERELAKLREEYANLKRAFGDLSLLFETGGQGWRSVKWENMLGMLELLMPWARQDREALSMMSSYVQAAQRSPEQQTRIENLRTLVEGVIEAAAQRLC